MGLTWARRLPAAHTVNTRSKVFMPSSSISPRLLPLAALLCAALTPAWGAPQDQAEACLTINDDAARLACYDRRFGRSVEPSPDAARPASVLTPVVPCEPERRGRLAGRSRRWRIASAATAASRSAREPVGTSPL